MKSKLAIWAFIFVLLPILSILTALIMINVYSYDNFIIMFLVLGLIPLTSIILSLILSIISLNQMRKNTELNGKGYAVTSLTLAVLYLIILILKIFYII